MAKVHIIGAGLAGLAAAVKLIKSGHEIALYETAPQAGGRCRSYKDALLDRVIDNGNHLILGANKHALAYIEEIQSHSFFTEGRHSQYFFIDLASGSQWKTAAFSVLRTFFHLAFAKNIQTVNECVDTSSVLYHRFIHPFCIAVLNTDPADASAVMLRNALAQIVRSSGKGLKSYQAKYSLSESLIDPALKLIKEAGGKIHYSCGLKSLEWSGNSVHSLQFTTQQVNVKNEQVILATSPQGTPKLLPELKLSAQFNAIVNGHFLCPDLEWPIKTNFIGITNGIVQWIFYGNGVISTTTSAANVLALKDHYTIATAIWDDVKKALKLSTPLPVHRIICEKHATLKMIPAGKIQIPQTYGNLFLAGDYTIPELPNSIESAIQSGFLAAQKIV